MFHHKAKNCSFFVLRVIFSDVTSHNVILLPVEVFSHVFASIIIIKWWWNKLWIQYERLCIIICLWWAGSNQHVINTPIISQQNPYTIILNAMQFFGALKCKAIAKKWHKIHQQKMWFLSYFISNWHPRLFCKESLNPPVKMSKKKSSYYVLYSMFIWHTNQNILWIYLEDFKFLIATDQLQFISSSKWCWCSW